MAYITTALDCITAAQRRIPQAAFTSWITDANWLEWINTAQYKIIERVDILEQRWDSTTFPAGGSGFILTVGTYKYTLPSDFFRISVRSTLTDVYINGQMVPYQDRRDSLEYDVVFGLSNAPPESCWIWNNTLYLYPPPDSAYTSVMYYYRLPAEVTVDASNIDLGPNRMYNDVVVDFLVQMAMAKDLDQRETVKNEFFEKAISTMYSESRQKLEGKPRGVRIAPGSDPEF